MKLNKPTKRILIMLIVLLLAVSAVVGSASAGEYENRINDGMFYYTTTWNTSTDTGSSLHYSTTDFIDNSCEVKLHADIGQETYAYLGQGGRDFTDVNTLSFKAKCIYGSTQKSSIRVLLDGSQIFNTDIGGRIPSSYYTYTVTIPQQYRHSGVSLNFEFITDNSVSSSPVTEYCYITDVSAYPTIWNPHINSIDNYTWDNYNIGDNNYGMNLSMSSTGWVYGNFDSTDFDLGGALARNCELQIDSNGDGTVDESGYWVSDSSFNWVTSYNSAGVYYPQIRLYNGHYYSSWYQLPLTVVARLQIDTAGALISGSDGYVAISASDILLPSSSWGYLYEWNFNYPNGGSSYKKSTTDTGLNFSYAQISAPKAQYSIGLSGELSNGNYSVTIPTNPFINAIDLRSNSVTFGNTTYTAGDNMSVTWDYSSWYAQNPSNTIQLRIYRSSDNGVRIAGLEPIYTYQLSNTTGTKSDIVAPSTPDYYSAYLWDATKNQEIENAYTKSPASVTGLTNLTIQLLADNVTFTDSTTVTIYEGQSTTTEYHRTGFVNPVTNVTSGSVTFENLPYGGSNSYYTIKAETVGYSTLTATVMLPVADNILRMDFVKGASEGGYTGGVGTAYASTFVTIRVIDVGTGMYQSGVQMTIQAKQATNPAEWFANLFGSAWGSTIAGTLQTGITDSQGGATFAVFPNYRYQVDLTYNDRTWQYTFQPSTLVTEEVIRLDITEPLVGADKTDIINVDISSSKEDNKGFITVKYLDKSAKTTMLSIAVYEYIDGETSLATLDGTANPLIITESSYGGKIGEYTQGLTINRASGKSYIVSVEALSETFGLDVTKDVIKRSQAVEFKGMRIPIGNIPDGLYLVICFVVLVMLGAVGTQFNSRFYAIVVAVVGIFMLWAGWMGALGIVGEGACVVAFILAILYYIATGNHPQ